MGELWEFKLDQSEDTKTYYPNNLTTCVKKGRWALQMVAVVPTVGFSNRRSIRVPYVPVIACNNFCFSAVCVDFGRLFTRRRVYSYADNSVDDTTKKR